MNTVIISTDLSSLAENAMEYGVQLAQSINGNVLLVNVYMMPVTMNDIPVMYISAEELKKSADEGLKRCQQQLQATHPDLQINTESRLGNVVDELESVCKEMQPFAVVMGTRKSSGIEQALFGNSTLSAIRHLKLPVISISNDIAFQKPKTIVLATDLLNIDKLPAGRIINFVKQLNAKLHIVHVIDKENNEPSDLTDQFNNKLSALQPFYYSIKDEDIAHGLQQYIQINSADLLMLIPHEHNYLERLFFKLHVKNILTRVSIPVVTIAE